MTNSSQTWSPGHSLGEFSALVAAGALSFEEGLKLVLKRAHAMQKACELRPSTMAAVLALPDDKVEALCAEIDDVVAPANYNCPAVGDIRHHGGHRRGLRENALRQVRNAP